MEYFYEVKESQDSIKKRAVNFRQVNLQAWVFFVDLEIHDSLLLLL